MTHGNTGRTPINKGKPRSTDTKLRISIACKGKQLGKVLSLKTRKKISEAKRLLIGEVKTPINKLIRASYMYRQWISDIFTRDDYTCQECLKRGVKLHAHHIKPFASILKENQIDSVEKAFICSELWNINNGKTLCVACHELTDSYKGKYHKLND